MFPARHAQILYPSKVAFPALELIELRSLPKIEAIWDNQCPIEESFSQLKDLRVDTCGRLKTIVPFVMLPRLTHLQSFRVLDCASIESDLAWPTGVELFPTETTTLLPELKTMWLSTLPELKQTVLSSPELNDETVVSPKLTDLWINNCCRLKNVFSLSVAKNLKHLEKLAVKYCDGMQEPVAPIGKGREESDGELFFPQLKKLELANLKENLNNLKAALIEVQKAEEIDRNNARDIDPVISKWLDGAGKMKQDLEAFLEDKIQNKARGFCFKVPFPNCYWRFKLSRKASKESADVARLIKEGEPLKKGAGEVAHLAALQDSRSLTTAKECENFDSRSKVFNDILAALRDGNVTRVGIYGMPGVGKTTMMEQVKRAMVEKKEFDEVAVAVVSATFDIKSIQRKLASDLGFTDLAKEAEESVRAGLLRRRLKINGKKILVILDDVWDKLPWKDMGLDFGDSRGCKILMTSRKGWVCEANKCLPFLINVLSKEEAWGLFRQHAGNCVEDADINPVAMDVLNECGGLPLIIRAVGEALKDGKPYEWNDAKRQFKNFTPRNIVNLDDQVYKTLELSFNKLNPEGVKSCLLLCSLFPEDAEISIDDLSLLAMAMGFLGSMDSIEDARNRVLSLVKDLKTSCLLLGCEDEDKVKLHDVIRDVAINIASEDVKYRFMVKSAVSAWPEMQEAHRATISLRIENIPELPRKLECPHDQLETLMLDCTGDSYTKIPGTFLDGLEKLKVLILVNVTISSVPILPNLRMLRIQGWWSNQDANAFDISTLKKLKKLEMLILRCTSIHKLPLDLGELKNLRFLDLRWCDRLNFIEEGVLSSLTHLEELYLPRDFDGWNAALVVELNSLTRLTALETCAIDFKNLPDYQLCNKLIRYDISVGPKFYREFFGTSSTRTISIGDVDLVDRKDAVKVLVERAEELVLTVNKTLKNLFYESSGDGFQHLKVLKVGDCEGMEYLLKWTPPLFQKRSFSKLEVLVVCECKIRYLVSLPMVKELEHLRHLQIESCHLLEAVVVGNESKGEGEESLDPVGFQSLKLIYLEYLPELTSFYYEATKRSGMFPARHAQILYPSKVAFPALELIELRSLPKIEAIWDNQCPIEESFSQLKDLRVDTCGRLKTIVPFVMLPRLTHLQSFRVLDCASIESDLAWPTGVELFPTETTTLLPELKTMWLSTLPELKQTVLSSPELNDETVVSPKLTDLWINNCCRLKNVFSLSVAKNLKHLEKLAVKYCDGMQEPVAPIGKGREESDGELFFPQLKKLELASMKNLTKFWGCEYEEHSEEEIQEVGPVLINQPLPFHSNKVQYKFPAQC
ncbi:hypothetical protein RJ639_040456 [Escallonia herrerae]|uniref:AAA+ ATPase domain-containing protein n=1 Tax=Escallonia herrerae TaxID=1293975 RepID=A0AA88WEU5_9ASTE|nr:hypothetical protein RJ639_040456 [Escallonia herrerae]